MDPQRIPINTVPGTPTHLNIPRRTNKNQKIIQGKEAPGEKQKQKKQQPTERGLQMQKQSGP